MESSHDPGLSGHNAEVSAVTRKYRSSVPVVWLMRRRATPLTTTVPFEGTVMDTFQPSVHAPPIVDSSNGDPLEAMIVPGPGGPCGPAGPAAPAGPVAPAGPCAPFAPVGPIAPVAPVAPPSPFTPTRPGITSDKTSARTARITATTLSPIPILLLLGAGGADIGCGAGIPPPYDGCMRVIATTDK